MKIQKAVDIRDLPEYMKDIFHNAYHIESMDSDYIHMSNVRSDYQYRLEDAIDNNDKNDIVSLQCTINTIDEFVEEHGDLIVLLFI